jgi:hypothetical protein
MAVQGLNNDLSFPAGGHNMISTVFSFPFRRRLSPIVIFQLFFLTWLFTLPFFARAQHSPHDHAGMSMDAPVDPGMQAKLLR